MWLELTQLSGKKVYVNMSLIYEFNERGEGGSALFYGDGSVTFVNETPANIMRQLDV